MFFTRDRSARRARTSADRQDLQPEEGAASWARTMRLAEAMSFAKTAWLPEMSNTSPSAALPSDGSNGCFIYQKEDESK
jgi:hypothetical protein